MLPERGANQSHRYSVQNYLKTTPSLCVDRETAVHYIIYFVIELLVFSELLGFGAFPIVRYSRN
jgi:hypothetical protein